MSTYAIIKLGASQYTIEEGHEYSLPKFNAEEGKKLDVTEVLAVGTDKDLKVGSPFVANAKVTISVLSHDKGEKVTQRIYKAKSRYHKTRGHRKLITKIKVEKISLGK